MIARTPVTFRYLRTSVTLLLLMTVGWPAASATGQPLFEGDLACPAGSPSGDTVAHGLLSALTKPLNSAWAKEAPLTIDPYPNYPEGQPPVTLELDNIPIDCDQDLDNWCFFEHGADHCSSAHANVKLNTLKGLKSLQFNNLTVTDVNLKQVAAHFNRGPDASKITDGVFAPEGADWNDPYYTVVLGWEGAGRALTIDLGADPITIDGTQITVQADRHAFQLDYYDDASSKWISYVTVPELKNVTGLHTRSNLVLPTGSPTTFTTRSVRLWALHPSDNDYNFSISEVQLRDSTGQIISIGKPALGPQPYQITDGILAQPGTSSTDPQYAVVLNHETGPAPALGIDLGAVMTICSNGYDCLSAPAIQADNDDVYQFDYSTDGKNWITYPETFPSVSGSGLQTRNVPQCNARPDLTQPCSATNHNPNFQARYVRVYAVSGGATFAVSELQLWDISSNLVSVGAPTYGPEPLATNGDFAPDQQTDWNDSRYATILPPCSMSASNAKSICPPPSSPPTSPALTAALLIDLTASFPVDHLVIQADRHQFQLDSSTDGVSWTPLWTVPAVSGSGLITRTSPSLGDHQARYLRVYGTAGSDNNYSVSELQVFTSQANTACAYDGGANPGENLACSYDGQFSPGIVLPNDSNTTLPLTFYLESAEIRVTCDFLVYHDTYTLSSATDRNCAPTLELASPPPADFCAGSCSTGGSILSYAQIPDEQLKFVTTSLNCTPSTFDDGIEALLEGVVAGVAAEAVQGLYNGILNYHNKPNSLVPFPPTPGMCPATVSEPPPPTPSPDNISGLWGRATRVGSATNSATLRIMGRFMVEEPLALDQAALTLDALLRESGAGELVQGPAGSLLVPLSLHPRKGSKPDKGIYRTPRGTWPIVRAQVAPVKGLDAQSGLMEFSLEVDRATILGPAGCAGGPPLTAPLTTSFRLVGGSEAPVWVHATADWQCRRKQLKTP